jgi:hypothetical protein
VIFLLFFNGFNGTCKREKNYTIRQRSLHPAVPWGG